MRWACLGLGFVLAFAPFATSALAGAPPRISPDAQQFLAAIRANFQAWDLAHDGKLTKVEIEKNMQNPAFRGDAAAALAAMKWGLEKVNPKNPDEATSTKVFTLAELNSIEATLTSGGKLVNPTFSRAVMRFRDGRKIIERQTRALFAAGVPHLAAIRQDWDSDCYFNSGVGSVAQASPQTIIRLIKPNPDGTFTVAFPFKPPQKIPAPTDAEIAAYTDAADGIWFNVLEKAYANIRKIDPKKATAEPLDAATLIGGNEEEVVSLVSGHKTKHHGFPLRTKKTADETFLRQVRDDLASAFRDHRAVVASKFHHAFAVVAYDPRTDTVIIHNPYDGNGSESMPNGEMSVSYGGYLSLSTEKFVENFNGMGVELAVASNP